MLAINRRSMLLGASAMAAAMSPGAVLAGAPQGAYEDVARRVWRPLDGTGGMHEIVRAGTLAASSHNTQPWRFTVSSGQITIRPDFNRRCPVVDPDDHHLFASLGCAVENMVQAATAFGFSAEASFDAGRDLVVIDIVRAAPSPSPLAGAIIKRQCTRAEYDGRAVGAEDLNKLGAAGRLDGVECVYVTGRHRMDAILDYIVQGNTAQMRDPAFMAELVGWIRFNDGMAVARLDGLAARSSGSPSLPAWIGRLLLPLVMTERSENDRYASHVRSSAGIAVFAAASNDKAGWIAAGRACQRFALQATALDIRHAFLNQPVEVASLRAQLASWLGLGDRRPDLVVRFGRGRTLPPSLRRPVEAVIDQP